MEGSKEGSKHIVPAEYQPALPHEQLLLKEPPDSDAVPLDVVFVGAGPAGLAGAIALARLVKEDNESGGGIGDVQIGVLEKAAGLGEHNLSGAVVNPGPFRTLFPELADSDFPFRSAVTNERVYVLNHSKALRIPAPPTMQNHGNYIASISEITRWMGAQAEALGINLFTGFPAASLLIKDDRVVGVRTTPTGLDRNGQPGSSFSPPTDLTARVVALAEGTRGTLSQAFFQWQDIRSSNPQIYALGVKEIWETKTPLDAVVHTLGWPLPTDAFGGTFFYPLEPKVLALGIVVGLDYRDASLDTHELLQRVKLHPLFRRYLDGGEMVEWGAKTIPEGGYFSLPERRCGNGVVVLGDAAGFVEVASLKGIHYAVQSGMLAAQAIFNGLKQDDTSSTALAAYDRAIDASFIRSDLYARRNMRLAFKHGFWQGGIKASLMTVTGGAFPGGRIAMEADAAVERRVTRAAPLTPDGRLTFNKLDAVFRSGNKTRDDIPVHLVIGKDIPPDVADLYAHMCPAGVYERNGDRLIVNAPNCVDCKATDVLGPRWLPREGGSGPQYRRM